MIMGKLQKLLARIDHLILSLAKERNNLKVNLYVDQFYYMQKMAELQLLAEQANEARQRLEAEYERVFCQWKKDARLLNRVASSSKTVM
jgi:hypothetical protein